MSSPRIILSGLGRQLDGLQWQTADILRIGRQANQDVVLRDFSVAPAHVEIVWNGRWILRDVAREGTHILLVNGRPPTRDQVLARDDVIQIGKMAIKVTELEGAVPEPPTIPPPAPLGGRGGFLGADSIRTSGAVVQVQARTKLSWDQTLEKVALGQDPDSRHGKSMLTLLRINHHLVHLSNLEELLQSILADALRALNAQRGSIALLNEATGELELKVNIAPGLSASVQRVFSRTLAERCFRLGESLLCQDVRSDDEMVSARSVKHGAMSSILCALLRTPRKRIGVLQLDRGPFQDPFNESDLYLADAVAASAAVGIESAQLVEDQREQFIQTVTSLARTVEVRDQYTGDHTRRVTDYSLLLAEEMKLPAAERYKIQVGTPLHDIGKIGIDDAILRKPGKLTTSEFEFMKTHTTKGAAILESICTLGPMIPIVRHHHEKWDGSGYPDRLGGDAISVTARIVAVADAFDAMTSDRPYRPAMPTETAFLELVKQSGKHFDPTCVQAFLRQKRKVEAMLQV